ncbi:MAG: hypothetical protein WC503_04530 [Candidatus Shapirobacteria bacterium]
MESNKTVIFVSNPFGFGPTGKTVALIEELRHSWSGKIVYAASPMCQETLPESLKNTIIVETIDERNEESLIKIFKKYNHPFIVCTLNRLAIKSAKNLGLRAFFIDSLAWMWKEIPEEYLLADTYYCFNLFGIKDRLPPKDNIKVISPVFGHLPIPQKKKEDLILFHIGGFKNPFQDQMSLSYLNLLVETFLLSNFKIHTIITGGNDALEYMKSKINNPNLEFRTLDRNEFLKKLNEAKHFITTSGLTATLESFALHTPTSFIPPTNLSQWKILKLLIQAGCANSKIEWHDFMDNEIDFTDFTEKDAVPQFHQLAKGAYTNPQYHQRFCQLLLELINSHPSTVNSTRLISAAGINGSQTIIADLLPYLG